MSVKVALLSDTHSFLDDRIWKHLKDVDEVWHAGDIGNLAVTDALKAKVKTLRAVYGNIDDQSARREFSKDLIFTVSNCKVVMTHIIGHPNNYLPQVKALVKKEKPFLVVCGHSHILKVFFNKTYNCLHINPGATGKHGFHKVQTFLKFVLEDKNIKDLEIVELKK